MSRIIKVSAPGKIILSGEHAVVYGYPEILSAIDRRLTVEMEEGGKGLNVLSKGGKPLVRQSLSLIRNRLGVNGAENLTVRIGSQIPTGCGLGSSAALAVAVTAALFELLKLPRSLKKINEIAYEIEKKQHGTPSGGDNTVVTYGGFIWYRKEAECLKIFEEIKPRYLPTVLLINSGRPKENTGEMVAKVRNFYRRNTTKANSLFRESEKLTRAFLELLKKEKSYSLVSLLRESEEILDSLGVISSRTRGIIQKIERVGGGAKISGAGGVRNGSGIILAYHQDLNLLQNFALKANLEYFKVVLGEKGFTLKEK